MIAALHARQRIVLVALADAVAPACGRMPAASALGLAEPGGEIDRVLALRPDIAAVLPAILDADGVEAAEMLRHLDGAQRNLLLQCIVGAYYLNADVRDLIGYAGQQALSLGRGEIGAEDLLADMMEQPPRWRRPPADEKGPPA